MWSLAEQGRNAYVQITRVSVGRSPGMCPHWEDGEGNRGCFYHRQNGHQVQGGTPGGYCPACASQLLYGRPREAHSWERAAEPRLGGAVGGFQRAAARACRAV